MELLSRRALMRWSVGAVAGVSVAFAADWQKTDASQWSSDDTYQILNNSPWSKPVTVATTLPAMERARRGGGGWDEGMPRGVGMGRGGWDGGGMDGPGMGRRRSGYPGENGPTVTVRWESALPVRLAEAKSSGGAADAAALKPVARYVIAVIGMPKSGFAPRGGGPDSDNTSNDQEFASHLKTITTLSFGHQRIGPDKVELNRGRDDRTVFYFDKTEPITLKDKEVEFRVSGDRMQIRKKFPLKQMEFRGKLYL